MLTLELEDLKGLDFDQSLTRFDTGELDQLLRSLEDEGRRHVKT